MSPDLRRHEDESAGRKWLLGEGVTSSLGALLVRRAVKAQAVTRVLSNPEMSLKRIDEPDMSGSRVNRPE